MIKLVAIDLDGTLLTDDKKISRKNKETLKLAKSAGVKIVVCTGRPLKAIGGFLAELELEEPGDYSITFNGGLVQKNDTGETIEKATLATEDVLELFEMGRQLAFPIDAVSEGNVFHLPSSEKNKSIYDMLNASLHHIYAEPGDITDEHIYNKVVVAFDADFLDQQIPKIPQKFQEKFEVIKTRDNLLEFMPKGVTKAYGISLLARDLGIGQAEVMAIGDEENDLSMIEYAGVGVAMENAVEAVRQAADYIAGSNEEDGVAEAVERFVLKDR